MNNSNSVIWIAIAVIMVAVILVTGQIYLQNLKYEKDTQIRIQQSIEKMQLESNKKQEEEERQSQLDSCIDEAQSSYSVSWLDECKVLNELSGDCLQIADMTWSEFGEKNNLATQEAIIQYYKKRSECSCRLPKYNADSINDLLKEWKEDCYKKFSK